MTDKKSTELREKLDELGIEHFDYDKGGRTQTMWESPEDMRHFTYETAANPAKTAKLIIEWFPTPEQAIAATLGNNRERALEKLVRSLYASYHDEWPDRAEEVYAERIRELGIEVVDDER